MTVRIVVCATVLLSLCSCSARVESPKSLEELYELQMQMLVDPALPESDRDTIMAVLEKSDDRILWKVLIEHWEDLRTVDPEYQGDWNCDPDFHETLLLAEFCHEVFFQQTYIRGFPTKQEMREWWERSKELPLEEIHEQYARSRGKSSWKELQDTYLKK